MGGCIHGCMGRCMDAWVNAEVDVLNAYRTAWVDAEVGTYMTAWVDIRVDSQFSVLLVQFVRTLPAPPVL